MIRRCPLLSVAVGISLLACDAASAQPPGRGFGGPHDRGGPPWVNARHQDDGPPWLQRSRSTSRRPSPPQDRGAPSGPPWLREQGESHVGPPWMRHSSRRVDSVKRGSQSGRRSSRHHAAPPWIREHVGRHSGPPWMRGNERSSQRQSMKRGSSRSRHGDRMRAASRHHGGPPPWIRGDSVRHSGPPSMRGDHRSSRSGRSMRGQRSGQDGRSMRGPSMRGPAPSWGGPPIRGPSTDRGGPPRWHDGRPDARRPNHHDDHDAEQARRRGGPPSMRTERDSRSPRPGTGRPPGPPKRTPSAGQHDERKSPDRPRDQDNRRSRSRPDADKD